MELLPSFGPAAVPATDAAVAVLVNLGALSEQMFLLATGMGLCALPGTWAGAWLVRRTPLRVHTVLIEALIACGGAILIWGAVT
ncbi:hypothetical protein OG2516_00609 [Oceanicola granulosus HTCC2516]|uniref:Membrane transporter protein n=1 Tax=Oceanicola granulosus (strain ATCC BAA-861 / DSM 15982 / KCTC 12143 / HTCC2516) TaxID=314256 RepID=Q2CJB8_OCEGH|nr:hypothetical protein [Oceanicola granulosus]EAR52682.1 hypothetical protein OG2516_00609 [Oceanicola granulosus HTCC2516]